MPSRLTVALLACLVAACATAPAAQAGDYRFRTDGRIVAVSDPHGALEDFRRTLAAAQLLDGAGSWIGGDATLVITGDLLDRGADSRAIMDLVMRLEDEAAGAGGAVHLLLGNHEVMNLVGDLRYVADGEYAAFAGDETADEREAAWRRYRERRAAGMPEPAARAAFDEAHPPGFFAHRRAFGPDGRYGRWLLGQPFVVVVNDTAFVHGGLSPTAAAEGLDGLNRRLGDELRNDVNALAALVDAGVLLAGDGYHDRRELLDAVPDPGEERPELTAALQVLRHDAGLSMHSLDGPTWYRGNAGCQPLIEADRLDRALESIGARRLVVGHTPTVGRRVVSRLDGRIIEIDTGMLEPYYGGRGHALVIDAGRVAAIDEQGDVVEIADDPRLQGAGELTAAGIEALLARGEVTVSERRGDGSQVVRVAADGREVAALFRPGGPRASTAYRLDRLLGLTMVPPAVARRVGDEDGWLQLLPAGAVNEAQRREARAGGAAWCPLTAQWAAMYLFDALTGNAPRGANDLLYDRGSWQLFLLGHGDAFGSSGRLPRHLAEAPLELTPAWREALAGLDETALADIGLDRRAGRALLKRRDRLLERAD